MTKSVVEADYIQSARQRVNELVNAAIIRKRIEAVLGGASISIVLFFVLSFRFLSVASSLLICVLSGVGYYIYKVRRPSFLQVGDINMAEHLNRHFSDLEESLALIFAKTLTPLAEIQRYKVAKIFLSIDDNRLIEKTKFNFQLLDALIVNACVVAIALGLFGISEYKSQSKVPSVTVNPTGNRNLRQFQFKLRRY